MSRLVTQPQLLNQKRLEATMFIKRDHTRANSRQFSLHVHDGLGKSILRWGQYARNNYFTNRQPSSRRKKTAINLLSAFLLIASLVAGVNTASAQTVTQQAAFYERLVPGDSTGWVMETSGAMEKITAASDGWTVKAGGEVASTHYARFKYKAPEQAGIVLTTFYMKMVLVLPTDFYTQQKAGFRLMNTDNYTTTLNGTSVGAKNANESRTSVYINSNHSLRVIVDHETVSSKTMYISSSPLPVGEHTLELFGSLNAVAPWYLRIDGVVVTSGTDMLTMSDTAPAERVATRFVTGIDGAADQDANSMNLKVKSFEIANYDMAGVTTPIPANTQTSTLIVPTNTLARTPTSTATNTSSASGNLVLNPGFETTGSSAADAANWTEGTNHTRASDKFHTGGWSLHSTFRGPGTDTRTAAPILVSPNTTYIYSGYIWRTNTAGGVCMDMADIVGERQLCTGATGSWQFLSGTWSSGSNTSVTLRLITDGSPTGDIWFDDISLLGPGNPGVTLTNTPVVSTNTPVMLTNTPVVLTNTPVFPTNTQPPAVTNTPATSGSLVLNSGFETQGTSAADAANWTEGANHIRASDKFHTGGWSLHSTFRGTSTDTRTAAPITVSPNTTYTYSGYIWRANATGGVCLDMADIVGERQLCTSVTGNWQLLSETWNSGSNTSITLRLITDGSPTGDIWFDDISLEGLGAATNTHP